MVKIYSLNVFLCLLKKRRTLCADSCHPSFKSPVRSLKEMGYADEAINAKVIKYCRLIFLAQIVEPLQTSKATGVMREIVKQRGK